MSELEKERLEKFTTISDMPIERLYTSDDLKNFDEKVDLGVPGEFPYTRGVYPSMHRGRLWTMRQFAGFGTAEDTNGRFKYLLAQGQTGLSTAFHFPTLMGYDSDDPRSRGEVGVCGVAIDSLRDMETLFSGIPLEKVTVSMTINGPAAIILAFFIANAEKQGCDLKKIGGTIQNDVLKEYMAQNSYLIPPDEAMRVVVDMIEHCSRHLPKWNPVSISGYHIREAGSTAVQELAFTLSDGLEYVKYCVNHGMNVDDFAPRLSFFFNAHMDFFEEIAKYRAARRIWAREMKRRYNPQNPNSLRCRFHVQTAGCSLTAQQPMNNIVRTTVQALAAVLGGCQSLHTNSMDETLALPTEKAVMVALRTQQIIAHESGVANTIDALAGSYFIESLTQKMADEAMGLIQKIDAMGGMVKAIKTGYPMMAIAEASHRYQRQLENKEKLIVGVNAFTVEDEAPVDLLKVSPDVERRQVESLRQTRASRDAKTAAEKLQALRLVCRSRNNVMPALIDCAHAYCTIGEMAQIMREVFGTYHDPGIY
jgi:methylmalonyl-CoA mutase N-terminal domain/subunit